MGDLDDGKVRIRCTTCGKRVKFPAGIGGATFRCPSCHTVIIAPLDENDVKPPEEGELRSLVAKLSLQREPDLMERPLVLEPEAAQLEPSHALPKESVSAIERFTNFVVTETRRIAQLSQDVLYNDSLSNDERNSRLVQLRHAKAVAMRRYVELILGDMEKDMAALRDHPASETDSVKARLARLVTDRKGFQTYINVMFQHRTQKEVPAGQAAEGAAASAKPAARAGATPPAPAAGTEQPSTA